MAPRKPKSTDTEALAHEPSTPTSFESEAPTWTDDLPHHSATPEHPRTEATEPSHPGGEEPSTKVVIPNPYAFRTDKAAGVALLEDRKLRLMQLQFESKPSDAVRMALREAGFRWKSQHQAWELTVDREQSWTARAQAEKTFQQVTGMIRQELGLTHEVA